MNFDLPSVTWMILVIALAAAPIVALMVASRPDRRTAPDRLLGRRLHHSRLGVMLHRHHVTEGEYLSALGPDAANAQIETCAHCHHKAHCDEVMACKDARARADLKFCPNGETVAELSLKRRA